MAAILLAAIPPALAAEPSARTVGSLFNWYYATSFGTGVYTVDDSLVTVLAMPFGRTLREPDVDHWGVRLSLPVSVALGNFDLFDPDLERIDEIKIAAWSVLPGIELVIPLKPHWRAKPFANIGRATEIDTDKGATVYQIGVTTRYEWRVGQNSEFTLGGKVIYAGYRSVNSDSEPIALVALGVAAGFPTSLTLADGHRAIIGLHAIGTSYLTDLRFQLPDFGYTEIHSEIEIGMTLGLRPAVAMLGVALDRIGLGYVASNQDLRGIRLVTEFPF